MKTLEILRATADERSSFGLVRPSVMVRTAKQALQKTGAVTLQAFSDDLDDYEADFLKVSGVPVVIRRYRSDDKNMYTLLINDGVAIKRRKDPVKLSQELLHQLGVAETNVIWSNPDLAASRLKVKRKDDHLVVERGRIRKTQVVKKSLAKTSV